MFCIDLQTIDIVSKIFSVCLKINHITDILSLIFFPQFRKVRYQKYVNKCEMHINCATQISDIFDKMQF